MDRGDLTAAPRRCPLRTGPPRTGKRGRPRTRGDWLPTPPDLARAATDWVDAAIDVRGVTVARRLSHRDVTSAPAPSRSPPATPAAGRSRSPTVTPSRASAARTVPW